MGIPKRLNRQSGRHALVDGIPFALPVNSQDSPALMAAFPIDADKAAALMPGNELHPFRLWGNTGVFLVTVIDYYSRYLLAAHLTPSYATTAAISALELARNEAERVHGPLSQLPFLVTDNGSTFISKRFVAHTKDLYQQVRIAYRTPTQLGLLERFHRTLKEEEVYWQLYDGPAHARDCIAAFRDRYNERRPHWALVPQQGGDPATPFEVYTGQVLPRTPPWQGWAKAAKAKLDSMLEEAA